MLVHAQDAAQEPGTVTAVRVARPPVIDGRDDDVAWRGIAPVRGFRQYDPGEDIAPSFETEFRVAYDDRFLYVLVRAYDPHPDSIAPLLSRRDVKTKSDQIGLIIDGFRDRRNAMEFIVNPAGVKRDGAFYNDATEDMSWDGVWDVGVRIDEKGWVAEFRIPFHQLRFAAQKTTTFGLAVFREVARLNEGDAWPLVRRRSVSGIVSQLGALTGLADLPPVRRTEVLPYLVSKSVPDLSAPGRPNRMEVTQGVDAKIGLGPNLTLDATINPDFGQVEADPAVLNLTAFETRFDERRLFFQEGIGLFRCPQACDGPFYTRRIGRTPQLRASDADPAFTPILGAAKLTGRFENGMTLAILDAVTGAATGTSGTTIEPETNYFIGRIGRESPDGSRQLGVLVTDVRRSLDSATAPWLRRAATMGMLQGSVRFGEDAFEFVGYAAESHVTGTASAIAQTQQSSVHYYQRPDGDVRYDSTRTVLDGGVLGATIRRVRGAVRFETNLRYSQPGQEMNDAGFVTNVDDASIREVLSYQSTLPNAFFRNWSTQLSGEAHTTVGGLPTGRSATFRTNVSLLNNWGSTLSLNAWDLGGVVCVSCARGGPSLRRSPAQSVSLDVNGDSRDDLRPRASFHVTAWDEHRSFNTGGWVSAELRVASRFSASLSLGYDLTTNDQQWVANYGDLLSDTTHYTFARLDQRTISSTLRVNWTATPTLSVQLYGQPFVSAGAYSNWRELNRPRAEGYDDRFRPYGDGATPGGFNVKQFNSNAVVRWEYRPGSAIFVVWQQGRYQDWLNPGTFDATRDAHDLFIAPPQNTLLVKCSYWLNP